MHLYIQLPLNIIAKYILFGHKHHNTLKVRSFIYNITSLVSNLTLRFVIGSNISPCHYIYKAFWISFMIRQLYTNFMTFKWPWVLQNKGKTIFINLQKLLNLAFLGSNEYKSNIWFLILFNDHNLGCTKLISSKCIICFNYLDGLFWHKLI